MTFETNPDINNLHPLRADISHGEVRSASQIGNIGSHVTPGKEHHKGTTDPRDLEVRYGQKPTESSMINHTFGESPLEKLTPQQINAYIIPALEEDPIDSTDKQPNTTEIATDNEQGSLRSIGSAAVIGSILRMPDNARSIHGNTN